MKKSIHKTKIGELIWQDVGGRNRQDISFDKEDILAIFGNDEVRQRKWEYYPSNP